MDNGDDRPPDDTVHAEGPPRRKRRKRSILNRLGLRRRTSSEAWLAGYRRLAMQLSRDLGDADTGRCIMLTGTGTDEIRPDATLELAEVLAEEQDKKVLVVQTCSGKGSLSEVLGLEPGPGLVNALNGSIHTLESLFHQTGHPNVFILGLGTAEKGLVRLLSQERLQRVLDELRRRFGFVLLHCRSVLEDPTALAFPPVVECVLLLVTAGVTHAEDVQACKKALEKSNARRIGLVLVAR